MRSTFVARWTDYQSVLHQLSVSLLLFQHDSSDQRERVWQTERKLEVGCGPAALHQLPVSLLLSQHDSSDHRERVWQTERKLAIGCGPAALRMSSEVEAVLLRLSQPRYRQSAGQRPIVADDVERNRVGFAKVGLVHDIREILIEIVSHVCIPTRISP